MSSEPGTALKYQVLRAEFEYESVKKDPSVAYALWCVTGVLGGHRFYLGDTGRSVAMLFTLGGLGVWTLIDGLLVGRRVRAVNRSRRAEIMARYGIVDASEQPPDSCHGPQLPGHTAS
ncbi:TM2 domain-containing protein [Actinoplanes aureus]|uniref:TM2 domain-containing protein n=1 Tax=Actinoplanes aureus TaxID=2792083 RepID=A0A931FYX4_9ACTN|nr:TM2 domain-containing protein [Actinoplanes aureus]MBG0564105.1 TM2 domain-containing protein [Actinoplanes aureus]